MRVDSAAPTHLGARRRLLVPARGCARCENGASAARQLVLGCAESRLALQRCISKVTSTQPRFYTAGRNADPTP